MRRIALAWALGTSAAMAGETPGQVIEKALFLSPMMAEQKVALGPCRMELIQVLSAPRGEAHAVFDLAPLNFEAMRVTPQESGPDVVIVPWARAAQARMWAAMKKLEAARRKMEDALFAEGLAKDEERRRFEEIDGQLAEMARAGAFGPELQRNHAVIRYERKGKPERESFGPAYPMELGLVPGQAGAFREALEGWRDATCKGD
ncbi:hypothetical protein [Marimonas lutisalis]|uniref:hypothetical protein n=1 Tax=Marimonas lutisalis TaxID=2545756 RepID=UPI0010F93510|nr:hypothetical protein [Marimonas lutisalis]